MNDRKPFEFTRREGEELTISTAVHEALGAASSCWIPNTGDAVFDSERATEIGAKLVEFIHQQIDAEQTGYRVQKRRSITGTSNWGIWDADRRLFSPQPHNSGVLADAARRALADGAAHVDQFEWWAVEFFPTIEELG